MGRPINSDGTWTKTPAGWRVKNTLILADGTKIRKSWSGKTKSATAAKRDAWLSANGYDPDYPERPQKHPARTLADLYAEVCRSDQDRGLKASTVEASSSLFRQHILPALGERRVDQISSDDVSALMETLKGKGLSSSTQAAVHKQLSKALNFATRRGYTTRNVALAVDRPSLGQEAPKPFTRPELVAIRDELKHHPSRARWLTQLMTGCRQSEVLGLAWDDFDLNKSVLSIRRTLGRVQWAHGCADGAASGHTTSRCPQRQAASRFGPPKSAAGTRQIYLPSQLVEVLKQWRATWTHLQLAGRIQTDVLQEQGGLVFPSGHTGGPRDHRADAREWQDILVAAGVNKRGTHAARHTAATQMLEQGVNPRFVQAAMGWSDQQQLQRYQHVTSELTKFAGLAVESAWAEHDDTTDEQND